MSRPTLLRMPRIKEVRADRIYCHSPAVPRVKSALGIFCSRAQMRNNARLAPQLSTASLPHTQHVSNTREALPTGHLTAHVVVSKPVPQSMQRRMQITSSSSPYCCSAPWRVVAPARYGHVAWRDTHTPYGLWCAVWR
eukprot:4855049-Prymnesium_polylepis.1